MARVDDFGNPVPAYAGGVTTPATTAPAPQFIGGTVPDWQTMESNLINSPFYKQGLESLTRQYGAQTQRAQQILTSQEQQDQIARDRAAHDVAMQRKAIRESMAGRGMLSSGQTGLELNQANYTFDNLMADIKNAATARQQEAQYNQSQLEQQLASDRYKLLTNTASYYQNLWWDPNTGAYVGPRGR